MSIFTKLFNRAGGYGDLAARFPGGSEPQGRRWERQSVMFANTVAYKFCVTVVVAEEGVWLQARPPAQGLQAAIMVPWRDVARAEPVTLYWRAGVRLICGQPETGRVTVYREIWDIAEPHWGAARTAPRPSA